MGTPSKSEFVAKGREAFERFFNSSPSFVGLAPGRINVIGEHVDYLGGLSIPTAIDRWAGATFAPRRDGKVVVRAEHFSEPWSFDISSLKGWVAGAPLPVLRDSWTKYVLGCFVLFFKRFPLDDSLAGGLSVFLTGNVPLGKGLSSSAALEVALLNAIRHYIAAPLSDYDLILIAQQVEHLFLGTPCGLMDQFASQFSRKDNLLVIDFASSSHSYVPASQKQNGLVFVCIDSMASRELAHSEYGKRVRECERGLQAVTKLRPAVKRYRDINLDDLDELSLADAVAAIRLRYMVEENQRAQKVRVCLEANNWAGLGELLNETHRGLRDTYQVSSAALDALQESAISHEACLGARMMGGGCGGCTLNLVKLDGLDDFCSTVLARFRSSYGKDTEAYVFNMAEGAEVIVS